MMNAEDIAKLIGWLLLLGALMLAFSILSGKAQQNIARKVK